MTSKNLRKFATVFLMTLAFGAGQGTHAYPHSLLLAQSSAVSQDDATAMARSQTGGRVLNVSEDDVDGRAVYRVKMLLPDGRVKVVVINAGGNDSE